jgi:hypothetical protein
MFRYTLFVFAALGLTAPLRADSWAEAMFDVRNKDYGTVPRGPMLAHNFRLTNNSQEAVHISNVRVSCGCVSASAAQERLAPGESTVIQTTMDTHRFTGSKTVTIYVQFDQPQWEEVSLWVHANGRDDISISPESLAFGKAKKGTSPSASVSVGLPAGSAWAVTDVATGSNYIHASVKPSKQDSGETTYKLVATIRPDTPVGKWYSDVWLKTNSESVPKIRVPLTIEIEPPLTMSSSSVALGTVRPGGEVERKVVIRGVQPFKITRIEGLDDQWSVSDATADSKTVHVLTVKLKAREPGELSKRFKVVTDLKEDGEAEFLAQAQAVAQ